MLRRLGVWGEIGGPGLEDGVMALRRRYDEAIPWSDLIGRASDDVVSHAAEDFRAVREAEQSFGNIVAKRGYPRFSQGGILCCLELLNPKNELALEYRGVGEPIVALLFSASGEMVRSCPIPDRLAANDHWWAMVRDCFEILGPAEMVGASSPAIFWAFGQKSVDPRYSPWDFVHPIHLLRGCEKRFSSASLLSTDGLKMRPRSANLARVEDWSTTDQLVMVREGLDAVTNRWEYVAFGREVGMTPIQTVQEGGAVPAWPRAIPRWRRPGAEF